MSETRTIKESGLEFSYDPANCFHIEKSQLLKSLGDGFKRVEFIRHRKNEVLMVEAKSSFPRPGNEPDVEKNLNDIYEKFRNSLDIFFSALLKRLPDDHNEFPPCFLLEECSSWKLKLILVINRHGKDISPMPIKDAIIQKLRREIKAWKLHVTAMHEEDARKHGLVQ